MKLHNMNFRYVFENRLPDPCLEELVRFLGSKFSDHVNIAIYGMAEAGKKIFDRLASERRINIRACFDVRPEVSKEFASVYKPEYLGKFDDLELIINTAPPQYVFEIDRFINSKNAEVDILNLYDLELFLSEGSNWQYLYRILIDDDRFEGALKDYHDSISSFIRGKMEGVQRVAANAGGMSRNEILPILNKKQMCLGRFLKGKLEAALASDNDSISELLSIAEEYPFYAIARDAAATLLVQQGRIDEAVDVFKPVLIHYPLCVFSATKYAELCMLKGDSLEGRRVIEKALSVNPSSSDLNKMLSYFNSGCSSEIKDKWESRVLMPALKNRKVNIRCAVPVWGKDFIDIFMKFLLSSLLAPGNLPYISKDRDVEFVLYTQANDIELVESYPQWQELSKIISVEIVTIESIIEKKHHLNNSGCKYSTMSLCHNDALDRCIEDGKALFIPLADFVYSSHFLKEAVSKLDGGYDVVFVYGFRVGRKSFAEAMMPYRDYDNGKALSVSSARILDAGKKNMHPFSARAMDSESTPIWPNYYIYEDSAGSLLHSVYGSNPSFILPTGKDYSIDVTLDGDLPYKVTDGGLGRYVYADDLDGEVMFEVVDEEDELARYYDRKRNLDEAAFWIFGATDPFSRYLGTRFTVYKNPDQCVIHDDKFLYAVEEVVSVVIP